MAEKKRPPTSGTRKGNGAGWGGPRKGSGDGNSRNEFESAGPGRGKFSIEGEDRATRRARHAEEMCEVLYIVAHNAEQPGLRIQAADKLLDRIEGRPGPKRDEVRDPIQIIIEGGLPSR
jgi:hypothetical protein